MKMLGQSSKLDLSFTFAYELEKERGEICTNLCVLNEIAHMLIHEKSSSSHFPYIFFRISHSSTIFFFLTLRFSHQLVHEKTSFNNIKISEKCRKSRS
jgi:hypothetical protein